MKKLIFTAILAASLIGCATQKTPLISKGFVESRESVTVLVMDPDVQMKFMTTSGSELRVDWSEAAEQNLLTSLQSALAASHDDALLYRTNEEMADEGRQVALLNEAVTLAMRVHIGLGDVANQIVLPLPHKEEEPFDYSLGSTVSEMTAAYEADYALFLSANSQFESSGVFFRNVLLASVGIGIPSTAYQGTFITLVDLETGQIVWANGDPVGDPRNAKQADAIIQRLFRQSPLAELG